MGRHSLNTSGYIYVITHPDYPNASKIGYSGCPKLRVSQANIWCPKALYKLNHSVHFSSDVRLVEYSLHKLLEEYRLPNGEWFSLPPDTAHQHILDYKENYHANYCTD